MYSVYTANEGALRIQYKCLVPIYVCIPRSEIAWPHYSQNRIIMFCLPISSFMYLWAIYVYIFRIGQPILLQPNRQTKYINRSQIHEGRNWKWGCAVSFLGTHKSDSRYHVVLDIHGSLNWMILRCSVWTVLLKAIHPFCIHSSSGCIIRNHSGCTILSCSGRDILCGVQNVPENREYF